MINHRETVNDPADGRANSPLHTAILERDFATAALLILNGANVNARNHLLQTPLMLAAKADDIETVKLLMTKGAYLTVLDCQHNSVLYYANESMRELLLSYPNASELVKMKNIYGQYALDVEPTSIAQIHILKKMNHFLQQNKLGNVLLDSGGCCNGFIFLHNMYSASGRRQYFFDTLQLIADWDETEEALKKPFTGEQQKYYPNLSALLTQWTNDILWFQVQGALWQEMEMAQSDRQRQYEMVKPAGDVCVSFVYTNYKKTLDAECLHDILQLLHRMPAGVCYDIGGDSHAVTGRITKNKAAEYYDPNMRHACAAMSVEREAELIVNLKYRARKVLTSDNHIYAIFSLYYFSNEVSQEEIAKFEFFSSHEYPRSKNEAVEYQAKTIIKFTPLHAAVLTGSVVSLTKLLTDGYCDLAAKNAFGQTAFDMAVEGRQIHLVELLLKYSDGKFAVGHAMEMLEFRDYDHYQLFLAHATPEQKVDLCCEAIHYGNDVFVEHFLRQFPELINTPGGKGNLLLYEALKHQRTAYVSVLFERGASPLKLAAANVIGKQETGLGCVIRVKNHPCLDMVMKLHASAADELGMTALHYASKFRRKKLMAKLIEEGVDIYKLSNSNQSPLTCVLMSRNEHVEEKMQAIQTLLQAADQEFLLPLVNQRATADEISKLLDTIKFDGGNAMQDDVLNYLQVRMKQQRNTTVLEKIVHLQKKMGTHLHVLPRHPGI